LPPQNCPVSGTVDPFTCTATATGSERDIVLADCTVNTTQFGQLTLDGTIVVASNVACISTTPASMFEISFNDVTLTTGCVGTIGIETQAPVLIEAAQDCPTGGEILITQGSDTHLVTITDTGAIELDVSNDGDVDATLDSCDAESSARCS
jgi:hypothetical protein